MIYVMQILYYIWYCHNGPNRSVDVMSYHSSNVARPVTIPTGFAQFCRGYYQIVIRSSLLTIITYSILILTILSTQQSHKYAIDLGVGHHRGVEALTRRSPLTIQFLVCSFSIGTDRHAFSLCACQSNTCPLLIMSVLSDGTTIIFRFYDRQNI